MNRMDKNRLLKKIKLVTLTSAESYPLNLTNYKKSGLQLFPYKGPNLRVCKSLKMNAIWRTIRLCLLIVPYIAFVSWEKFFWEPQPWKILITQISQENRNFFKTK
jgi:hypothetical protein